MLDKNEAREFAGLMEDYLDIPSFVCELIEQKLTEGKYEEVIKYIIQRRKELKNKNQNTN